MKNLLPIALTCSAYLLIGCSPIAKKNGIPSMFNTKLEAEQAAEKHFDCFGAHQMGDKWMPCEKHNDHHHH